MLVFIFLFLSACSDSESVVKDRLSPMEEIYLESVPESHSQIGEVARTASPKSIQEVTDFPYQNAVTEELPPPVTTLEPQLNLCSPLLLHNIDNLPAIISSPYNPPPPGKDDRHHGVDFGYWEFGDRTTMEGEVIQSILSGVVRMVLHDRFPYGNTVVIETPSFSLPSNLVTELGIEAGESIYTLYAHLDNLPLVNLGDTVNACDQLGEVGLSGNTDIAHLHIETRLGSSGTIFESMMFYSTSATIEEMENYKLWRTSGVFRHFDPMILLLVDPS
ncbi:MAG: M23 family metallopeptidase [Anaerolineales bacterium]|nr:M23 family metallopeptidase [Anaerolineales bacterium]